MNPSLVSVLKRIGEEFRDRIEAGSPIYLEVDIGRKAAGSGFPELEKRFSGILAVVPVREAGPGMKVMIDGRTFVDYAQLDSGLVVPGYVAREAGLPFRAYLAKESMVLEFA